MAPRIAHVVPQLVQAGAERVALSLCAAAREHGWSAEIICLSAPRADTAAEAAADLGIPVHYLHKPPGVHLPTVRRLSRQLHQGEYDLVHTHLGGLKYLVPSMVWGALPPVLHTLHSTPGKEVRGATMAIHRLGYRLGVQSVVLSQVFCADFAKMYGRQPSFVIPNGVPAPVAERERAGRAEWRAEQGFTDAHTVIMNVASLRPWKNQAMLLEAFGRLSRTRPALRLVLVGEGPDRPALSRQVEALGLTGKVALIGEVPDVTVPLAGADLFVLTSDFEGMPLAILEAMLRGIAVVSTAVGAVPEMLEAGKGGWLVPTHHAEAFAVAIGDALDFPAERALRAEHAVETARLRYTSSLMWQHYSECYTQLMQSGARDHMDGGA